LLQETAGQIAQPLVEPLLQDGSPLVPLVTETLTRLPPSIGPPLALVTDIGGLLLSASAPVIDTVTSVTSALLGSGSEESVVGFIAPVTLAQATDAAGAGQLPATAGEAEAAENPPLGSEVSSRRVLPVSDHLGRVASSAPKDSSQAKSAESLQSPARKALAWLHSALASAGGSSAGLGTALSAVMLAAFMLFSPRLFAASALAAAGLPRAYNLKPVYPPS
jgi:hypothetical protein